jgi:hypothetical protein
LIGNHDPPLYRISHPPRVVSTPGTIPRYKPLTIHKLIQESLSSLRSRGGHCFPIRWAARLASRIATIRFACDRVSSRRLARPPRRPIAARYSRTFFSVLVISVTKHPS